MSFGKNANSPPPPPGPLGAGSKGRGKLPVNADEEGLGQTMGQGKGAGAGGVGANTILGVFSVGGGKNAYVAYGTEDNMDIHNLDENNKQNAFNDLKAQLYPKQKGGKRKSYKKRGNKSNKSRRTRR